MSKPFQPASLLQEVERQCTDGGWGTSYVVKGVPQGFSRPALETWSCMVEEYSRNLLKVAGGHAQIVGRNVVESEDIEAASRFLLREQATLKLQLLPEKDENY